MICSFIQGRVRIRDARFKDEETAQMVSRMIGEYPGVSTVKANPRTGSLLIEYDPAELDQEQALGP